MAVIGHTNDSPRLEDAGYALAAEAAATLIFDIVAARRAHRYRERLSTSMTTDAAGNPCCCSASRSDDGDRDSMVL